jgi:hypothetical protein
MTNKELEEIKGRVNVSLADDGIKADIYRLIAEIRLIRSVIEENVVIESKWGNMVPDWAVSILE